MIVLCRYIYSCMITRLRWLLLLPTLFWLGCEKPDPTPATPTPTPPTAPPPPVTPPPTADPVGSRRLSITVASPYDLRNTQAHSLLDSVAMQTAAPTVLAPKDYPSALFFLDKTSHEILAVVRTPTTSTAVVVTAESVANALLTDVPAYHALTPELVQRLEREVSISKPYQDLVLVVDGLLKSKKPIYSSSPDFTARLVALHNYIVKEYLGSPVLVEGRLTTTGQGQPRLGQKGNAIPPFPKWLTRENSGTLYGNVHSYVYAEFTPLKEGSPVPVVLGPMTIPNFRSSLALSKLNLKDDRYRVQLNQTHKSAVDQNKLALGTKVTSMIFSLVLGRIIENGQGDCVGALIGSITSDIMGAVLGLATGTSVKDMLVTAFSSAKNTLLTRTLSTACLDYEVGAKVLAKAVAGKLNVLGNILTVVNTAYDIAEITPYFWALQYPMDPLAGSMQLHDSQLKEAWIGVAKEGTLKPSYAPGEKITPKLKLFDEGKYEEDWIRSGLTVEWKVAPGDGSVGLPGIPSLLTTKTLTDGVGTIEWTLPKDKSGEVTLLAEIKDKEGDHIKGSPLVFKVNVLSIVGTWKQVKECYQNKCDDITEDRYLTFDANGTYSGLGDKGTYTIDKDQKVLIVYFTDEDGTPGSYTLAVLSLTDQELVFNNPAGGTGYFKRQ